MSRFKPGESGNMAGRPKGTKNKTSEELRGVFQSFLERNMETLQADFDQLEPEKRLQFIEKIARLIIPAPLQELQRLTNDQLDELISRLKSEKQ